MFFSFFVFLFFFSFFFFVFSCLVFSFLCLFVSIFLYLSLFFFVILCLFFHSHLSFIFPVSSSIYPLPLPFGISHFPLSFLFSLKPYFLLLSCYPCNFLFPTLYLFLILSTSSSLYSLSLFLTFSSFPLFPSYSLSNHTFYLPSRYPCNLLFKINITETSENLHNFSKLERIEEREKKHINQTINSYV